MDQTEILGAFQRRLDRSYFGKYRAFVVDNEDPERRGRLRVTIPSVLQEEVSDWVLPCLPYGGGGQSEAGDHGFFSIPPLDAQVVVEFIEGDLSSPIWTGTFWRQEQEVPAERAEGTEPTTVILKSAAGHYLAMEDNAEEPKVKLKSARDALIEMDHEGSIALTDSNGATVVLDANAGTLTVEDANGNSMVMSSSGIETQDANGNKIVSGAGGVEVSSGAKVTISCSSVDVGTGGLEPLVKGTSFMSVFNTHTHVCPPLGGPSSPPIVPMTPAQMTVAAKGA